MNRFPILASIILTVSLAAAADTLYLHGGEQEQGTLKQITPDSIVFEGRDGDRSLPKEDVIRVQLQQPRMYDDVEQVGQVQDPDLKSCIEKQPSGQDYPSDGAAVLLQRQTYDLTTPGLIKETERSIIKILQQRGEGNGTQSVWFYEDTDTPKIDFALTVTPDGRVLHLSDAAVKNESIYARFPQYRRLARFRFACKEPRAGNILDVQNTVERRREDPLEPFYSEDMFGDIAPMLRKEVVVLITADREKEIVSSVSQPDLIDFAREENNGVVKLTWTLKQPQPGLVDEPMMPPLRNFVPTLTLAERATWKDVAKLYLDALDKLGPLPDELKKKAVELAKQGGPGAIYRFVARDIQTAPVPHPHYAPVPNAPGEAAMRGFANELDKNYLFCAMLKAADIPCAFALVRGRMQGDISNETPSNRAFNRSAVYLADEKIFAATGSDEIEFGALSGELYDAPALLIAPDTQDIVKTQTAAQDIEMDYTEFDAALDPQGNLAMTLVFGASGDTGGWMRRFKDMDRQELHNYLQQMLSNMHPGAILNAFETTDLADLSIKPKLTLKCSIAKFAVAAGDDLMLFHVPGVDYDAGDVGRPTRNHAMFFGHAVRAITKGTVRLPEGYEVYSVPENVSTDGPVVKYDANLKADDKGVLQFQDDFVLKVAEAAKEAYSEYKACKELRAGLSRQRIVLMKK